AVSIPRRADHARPRSVPRRARPGRGSGAHLRARRHGRARGSLPLPQGATPRLARPRRQARRPLSVPRDRGDARRLAQQARRSDRDPLRGEGSAMSHFTQRGGELHCEDVPLASLAAMLGTPLYVYSKAAILDRFRAFDTAFAGVPHLVCFAVKANDHLAILRLLAREGAGFDVVSEGELWKALRAGADGRKIGFSGVGKSEAELDAALAANILMINVESPQELDAVERVAARRGVRAPVSLRVNPDVDPKTHPYIATGLKKSKFGIDFGEALATYARARSLPHLDVVGIDCHIGSQLTEVKPFVDALARVRELAGRLVADGVRLRYLDCGGGLGITYEDETPPTPAEYAAAIKAGLRGLDCTLVLEPGRAVVGNAGVL